MKTLEESEKAEEQIKDVQADYNYRFADYSIGELLKKFVPKGQKPNFEDDAISGLYVPIYQRDFVWPENMKSRFIESLLMGVPIQPLFAFELDEDGNLELLDGVQRLSSVKSFVDNELVLSDLEALDTLNGFSFSDLNSARKRKFLNIQLKLYIIDDNTTEGVRADIFRRVNEGGKRLEPAEIRKGKFLDNKFYEFILKMADSPEFGALFSSTKDSKKLRGEKEELITRFFAFSNNYQNFVHSVKGFLDDYIINVGQTFDQQQEQIMQDELFRTLDFVQKNIPNGFRKSQNSKSIPRVRFEAISIGTNLALRENPQLLFAKPVNTKWINSNEFKIQTTSDAANNKSKVIGRIDFVKNCLLGIQDLNKLTYND
ncbi:Protein of unknown function DUF262 [Flexibacter flexilis DSM 6793]|uniref:GmrSD restriction endonucleases N-terminal domain-containing protein n=1 Tax=Flexibacter flexilis DSM 6793 TaxID=927664 RepID=A0A1I1LJU5_9BACT|nr:DUF262 domain-containing protein [Flexibacter flexilis]SFC73394.1 Protein of unknown function DUF262 [Flexibacter flexilis DSM 6793]